MNKYFYGGFIGIVEEKADHVFFSVNDFGFGENLSAGISGELYVFKGCIPDYNIDFGKLGV